MHRGGSKDKRMPSRRWEKVRQRKLAEHPLCMVCKIKPSKEVDHIKPIFQGGTDDDDNLQGICVDCHRVKTAQENGSKKVAIGINGWPVDEDL